MYRKALPSTDVGHRAGRVLAFHEHRHKRMSGRPAGESSRHRTAIVRTVCDEPRMTDDPFVQTTLGAGRLPAVVQDTCVFTPAVSVSRKPCIRTYSGGTAKELEKGREKKQAHTGLERRQAPDESAFLGGIFAEVGKGWYGGMGGGVGK